MAATWTSDADVLQSLKDTYAELATRYARSYELGGRRRVDMVEMRGVRTEIEAMEERIAEAATPTGVAVADFQRPV